MQAELGGNEAMTCQELLALSGALSAALPTGQLALDSFLNSLTKGKFIFDAYRIEIIVKKSKFAMLFKRVSRYIFLLIFVNINFNKLSIINFYYNFFQIYIADI